MRSNVVELVIKPTKKLHGLICTFSLTNNRSYKTCTLIFVRIDGLNKGGELFIKDFCKD